jgi:putative ABC transport system permease protein
MEIGPIWRALLRNKSSYILIALQIAATMALMVNAISIIQERTRMMGRPSGVGAFPEWRMPS